jgi:hypothetical protein
MGRSLLIRTRTALSAILLPTNLTAKAHQRKFGIRDEVAVA